MDLNTIKLLRDTVFVKSSKGIQIMGDNAKLYDTDLKDGKVVWDDVHQILYAFRSNNVVYTANKFPVEVEAVSYATIQYITAPQSYDDTTDTLTALVASNTITADQSKDILAACKAFKK